MLGTWGQSLSVVSANLNGIRSAARKGFFDWMCQARPDVVCVQETKAQMAELTQQELRPEGYHCYFADAVKKGYSGVGIYSRLEPDRVQDTLGYPLADEEGRYIEASFGALRVVSLYLPSGTSGELRQREKMRMLDYFGKHCLAHWPSQPGQMIIAGDFNIAHRPIDLKNWRNNQKNSGFLPEERAWLDLCFDVWQWVDAFRSCHPEREGAYTWWTYRGQARANNVGWRIDYQVVTPGLRSCIERAMIVNDSVFSDHAPLWIDYGWKGC